MESERSRPDWHTYFMQIAQLVATRSTCLRRQVGAVIVKNNRILSTGYNGTPSGITHCLERGCIRSERQIPSGERHELCRGLHAEQNAIIQAAYHGVSVNDADIFCTNQPCIICSKMIINAGIKKIFISDSYPDELAEEMLKEAAISLVLL
ncbi:MAG: cytidine/deoxycytidylate deaminase family protein [Deltaproteobacteria bacterium]|nr:cytidine/deoxycytidylate deaminase family protein [Candidatus Anaeroferrophillus wilburensis]MBN2889041.1 cytidine/deoxycytidylate deaminase family protein [Deltaproteobacteria bacterium]